MKSFRQRGMAAIEFLLASPVLLLIMAGILDFGQAFIDYTVLDKSVRNGARFAVTSVEGTTGGIGDTTEIKNMVVYGNSAGSGSAKLSGFTTGSVTVSESGKYVTVTGVYTYAPFFSPLPFTSITLNVPLTSSIVMRVEP